eukprot:2681734-Rhodomonas_salina.1
MPVRLTTRAKANRRTGREAVFVGAGVFDLRGALRLRRWRPDLANLGPVRVIPEQRTSLITMPHYHLSTTLCKPRTCSATVLALVPRYGSVSTRAQVGSGLHLSEYRKPHQNVLVYTLVVMTRIDEDQIRMPHPNLPATVLCVSAKHHRLPA